MKGGVRKGARVVRAAAAPCEFCGERPGVCWMDLHNESGTRHLRAWLCQGCVEETLQWMGMGEGVDSRRAGR